MSRRKREGEAAAAAAQQLAHDRAIAWQDAQHLALQITGYEPLPRGAHYEFGMTLEPGERAYRSFWCSWHRRIAYEPQWINPQQSAPPEGVYWPTPEPVFCLLTDRQLAFRHADGQLVQIYWTGLAGVSVDLPNERVHLDYDDGRAGALLGVTAPVVAVAAVAGVYGPGALAEHPALRGIYSVDAVLDRLSVDELERWVTPGEP